MSKHSKYLINERPLTVLPTLAKMVGIEKAIILQQIHYALSQPKSGRVLHDGEKYIWNTYKEWADDYFPFWSASAVQKHFLKLEKEGFLIAVQPNKTTWDRTKYYRLNYAKLQQISDDADVAPSIVEDSLDDDADVAPSDDADVAPSFKGTKSSTKSSTNNRERESARAGEITLGKISGVPVIDYSGDAADKKLYFEEIVDGLRIRLNSPNILPKEHEWVSAIKFAYENQHSPDAFLNTFDNLQRLKKLKRKDWRINAAMIENNIGLLDDLILEIKQAEEKQNGQRDETRKRTDTDQPNKYQASHESGADTLARLRGRIRKPERREPEPAAV